MKFPDRLVKDETILLITARIGTYKNRAKEIAEGLQLV